MNDSAQLDIDERLALPKFRILRSVARSAAFRCVESRMSSPGQYNKGTCFRRVATTGAIAS